MTDCVDEKLDVTRPTAEDKVQNHSNDRQQQDQKNPKHFVPDRTASHKHADDRHDVEHQDDRADQALLSFKIKSARDA